MLKQAEHSQKLRPTFGSWRAGRKNIVCSHFGQNFQLPSSMTSDFEQPVGRLDRDAGCVGHQISLQELHSLHSRQTVSLPDMTMNQHPVRPPSLWPSHAAKVGISTPASIAYSGGCRTAFQFLPDTVPIHIGQCSELRSDSFPALLEWCPIWPGKVSDSDWNRGPEGVERRGNGCQGGGSIQLNRERHLRKR